MHVNLELIIHPEPDGRVFLDCWDNQHGHDVCCEIRDGKLFTSIQSEDESEEITKEYTLEITLNDFISMVKTAMEIRND